MESEVTKQEDISYFLNNYQMCESIIISLLALIHLIYFVQALRQIQRDRNGILDKIDKLIFILGLLQIFLLIVCFILPTNSLTTSIKIVKIWQDLVIINIVFYLILEEDSPFWMFVCQRTIFICACLSVGYLGYQGFIAQQLDYFMYNCISVTNVIFSTFCLMISGVLVMAGYWAISIKHQYFRQNSGGESSSQNQISEDVAGNLVIQVVALSLASIISSVLQFALDYLAYRNCTKIAQCSLYVYSYNFYSLILQVVLKYLIYILPPISVYYVFYYRNKNKIKAFVENNERNIEIFLDNRSELLRNSDIEN